MHTKMNIGRVDKLLASFYEGTISQSDLDRLFDYFAHDPEIRRQRPEDASVLIPLALARKDYKSRSGRVFSFIHTRRAVAVAFLVVLLSGIIAIIEFKQSARFYTTDADCNYTCAEQWLNKTIQTAL